MAVAETLVPLGLDDLEEDRPDHVLGEDLEQDAFVADIAVDQDAVLLQSLEILVVAGDALVDQLVIGLDRILQFNPARAQFFERFVDVGGGEREMLDALALIEIGRATSRERGVSDRVDIGGRRRNQITIKTSTKDTNK